MNVATFAAREDDGLARFICNRWRTLALGVTLDKASRPPQGSHRHFFARPTREPFAGIRLGQP